MFYIYKDDSWVGGKPSVSEIDDTTFCMLLTLEQDNSPGAQELLDDIMCDLEDQEIFLDGDWDTNTKQAISDLEKKGYTYSILEEGFCSYGTTKENAKLGIRQAVLELNRLDGEDW